MNTKELLLLIKSLDVTAFTKYGVLVSYADIFKACKCRYGFDNPDLLKFMLESLEKEGEVETIRMAGFDASLIVGVRVK